MSKLCGSSVPIRQLVMPASCICSLNPCLESGVASQQRAICVENLCGRRHINAGIGDQQNDPVVDSVLKHRSSSEAQTDTSGSLRAATDDPATAAKRARPAPAAEVNPRLVARRVAFGPTR